MALPQAVHRRSFRNSTFPEARGKRFGPFDIVKLIGKNAVKLALTYSMRILPFVQVEHTTRCKEHPSDISKNSDIPKAEVILGTDGTPEFMVDRILAHRKRGRSYQWITLMHGEPQYQATWQPTRDFIDADGTMTAALLIYIESKGIFAEKLTRTLTGGGTNNETGNCSINRNTQGHTHAHTIWRDQSTGANEKSELTIVCNNLTFAFGVHARRRYGFITDKTRTCHGHRE